MCQDMGTWFVITSMSWLSKVRSQDGTFKVQSSDEAKVTSNVDLIERNKVRKWTFLDL